MEENNKLKRKTILSTLSLFFQSGYSAILGLIANLILTILLSPAIFGIYFTLLSIISLFNYFSDIGLAASLIQKKEINNDDIKTTFTIQQILVITLVAIGFFATSFVMKFYSLPPDGHYLYLSLLISFFISSLKTIPSIFLERKIQFQKIVLVQIIENTTFYLTVSILALLGFGLKSFTFAVIFRSLIGLIIMYSMFFWLPQIGISLTSLKSLLSFGVPFQLSSFLAIFKDDLITLYLGKVLGFEALGYIGWAKKWAEAPIRIIMDNISRVLFPVLSRIQHDKEKVARVIEKILDYQTTLLAPVMIGAAILMLPLTTLIPKYSKWQPALPLFYLFCISAFLSSLTWLLTTTLTKYFGYIGFPMTQVILSSTFILVVWQAKKIIHFNFLASIYKQLITTLIMGIIIYLIFLLDLPLTYRIFMMIATGLSSYFLILKILFKIDLIKKIRELLTL